MRLRHAYIYPISVDIAGREIWEYCGVVDNGVVDWNTGYELLCIQDKTLICKKAIFSTSYFRA
jgi:hypothetical protein